MRLRFKRSISINEPERTLQSGPDIEVQVGHLEHAGWTDTGMGFVPPGPKVDEAFE